MKILGIECTASPVSCALVENGKLKGEYFLNLKTTHSQTLLPMVESLLKLSDLKISDVDAIAVTEGPGSFTGVRIGISAVKGLAFADNKPIIPVSVLEAMAYGFSSQNCIVSGTMDARCNQVYNAVFKACDGTVTRLSEDRAWMIEDVLEDLKRVHSEYPDLPIFIAGDGADLFYKTVEGCGLKLSVAPENQKWQRASNVCFAAEKRAENGQTVEAEKLQPLYLRLPQAERELKANQQAKVSK